MRLGVLLALGLLDIRLNVRAGQGWGRRLQGGAEGLVVGVLFDRAHPDVPLGLLLEQLRRAATFHVYEIRVAWRFIRPGVRKVGRRRLGYIPACLRASMHVCMYRLQPRGFEGENKTEEYRTWKGGVA